MQLHKQFKSLIPGTAATSRSSGIRTPNNQMNATSALMVRKNLNLGNLDAISPNDFEVRGGGRTCKSMLKTYTDLSKT